MRRLGDTMPTAQMPTPYAAPFVPTTAFYASVIPETWRQMPGAIYSPHGWGPAMRPYYREERFYPHPRGEVRTAPFLGEPPARERYVAPALVGGVLGAIWALARGQDKSEMAKAAGLGAGVGLVTAFLIQLRGTRVS